MPEASLGIGRQRVGAFKNACVEKKPLNIRLQWNAGTARVSECMLKMLACQGCVLALLGPFPAPSICKFITFRDSVKSFQLFS